MIRTSYDPLADAFYARFAPQGLTIAETREVAPGVMVDFDATGDVIGVEVLSVTKRGRDAAQAQGGVEDVMVLDALAKGKEP